MSAPTGHDFHIFFVGGADVMNSSQLNLFVFASFYKGVSPRVVVSEQVVSRVSPFFIFPGERGIFFGGRKFDSNSVFAFVRLVSDFICLGADGSERVTDYF